MIVRVGARGKCVGVVPKEVLRMPKNKRQTNIESAKIHNVQKRSPKVSTSARFCVSQMGNWPNLAKLS